MKKTNYNLEFERIVNAPDFVKGQRLLLHVCCAPCSSSVLLRLKDYFSLTLLFYNPNIFPQDEYLKRKAELVSLLEYYKRDFGFSCDILDADYNHDEFLQIASGLENCEEGGARCKSCYKLRLEKCAKLAAQKAYDFFCTTLTISPLKNASLINEIGYSLERDGLKWLPSDFKKQNGFLQSIQLSKTYNLYRQDTCGCEFSKKF